MLYAYTCDGSDGFFKVSLANLAAPLPFTWILGPGLGNCQQLSFRSDYAVLYAQQNGDWSTVDLATGGLLSLWAGATLSSDMAGASLLGYDGSVPPDCDQATAFKVKAKAPKTVKSDGTLSYRATVQLKRASKKAPVPSSLVVTLPAGVSILSSRSSLKHPKVEATSDATTIAWTGFNMTSKTVKFAFKARVTAASGTTLTFGTTAYQWDGARNYCPVSAQPVQARVK
jgi:hypothetical protein